MSRATELTEGLRSLGPRPAGSDRERRAAVWAAAAVQADPRRSAQLKTFWARPNWALAQSWHLALGAGGSLLGTTQAKAGAAMILAALLCLVVDWIFAVSPGRWLTRERASQNVVSTSGRDHRVRLILTAYLDTGRLGLGRAFLGLGTLSWAVGALGLALVAALLRVEGSPHSTPVAVLAVIATVAIILVAAWLLLERTGDDDAEGVAAALALTRLLDAAAPAHMAVDLVLTGCGAGEGLGLRRYLRSRRRSGQNATNTIVLGFGPGPGAYFLTSDGPLLPLAFFGRLREMAQATGALTPRSARGCSAALPARMRQLPSLTVGGTPDAVVAAALDLVDQLDAYVGRLAPR